MGDIPDVDLEVLNREEVLTLFPEARVASQVVGDQIKRMRPHNSGIYFQNIPLNPLNNLAALPFKEAEDAGFHKIDLLSCPYPYNGIESMEELRTLLDEPIDWNWFTDVGFISTLFQVHDHINEVVHYAPQSIEDLACLIAIIRPAKQHLIGESWDTVRAKIWDQESHHKILFKKSHAIAYALAVALDARRKAKEYFVKIISMPQELMEQ